PEPFHHLKITTTGEAPMRDEPRGEARRGCLLVEAGGVRPHGIERTDARDDVGAGRGQGDCPVPGTARRPVSHTQEAFDLPVRRTVVGGLEHALEGRCGWHGHSCRVARLSRCGDSAVVLPVGPAGAAYAYRVDLDRTGYPRSRRRE